jgi:hypothetical protein
MSQRLKRKAATNILLSSMLIAGGSAKESVSLFEAEWSEGRS